MNIRLRDEMAVGARAAAEDVPAKRQPTVAAHRRRAPARAGKGSRPGPPGLGPGITEVGGIGSASRPMYGRRSATADPTGAARSLQ